MHTEIPWKSVRLPPLVQFATFAHHRVIYLASRRVHALPAHTFQIGLVRAANAHSLNNHAVHRSKLEAVVGF